LPHYIFPLYPYVAIIAAVEIKAMFEKNSSVLKVFTAVQLIMTVLIFSLTILLCSWFFPTQNLIIWGIIIVSALLLIFLIFNKSSRKEIIINGSIISVLMINFVMSLHIYPQLLKFQSGSQTAAFIHKNTIDVEELAVYRLYPNSLDFYAQTIPQIFESPDKLVNAASERPMWIFTDETGKKQLEEYGAIIDNIKTFDHFHISKLSLKFLNPKTRKSVLEKVYLIRVSGILG
jgi:hypothetical protein